MKKDVGDVAEKAAAAGRNNCRELHRYYSTVD